MNRLPHENYIRFLITTGYDSKETNEMLEEVNLPRCSIEYWDRQYRILFEETHIPKKIKKYWDNPKPKIPNGFFEYMSSINLKEAWKYNIGQNSFFDTALDASKDPDVSINIRALLAIRLEDEELSALISGKFSMNFPIGAVKMYRMHFFDIRIMSRSSWRQYLDTLENDEKSLLYKGLTGKSLELRAELDLPMKLSVSEHYQRLHVFAMGKFTQYRESHDAKADMLALKWAQLAMAAGDKYEKLRLGDATDFGKDLQFEFDYVETNFPSIGAEDIDQITNNMVVGKKKDKALPIPFQHVEKEDEKPE